MFHSVDGGRSQIYDTASQVAHRRSFIALMVGTHRSLTLPPKGGTIDVF
jgi:hypothetical protein